MVVLVVVVLAFVAWRGLFRDNDFQPVRPVDYRETVELAQDGDFEPIYPTELPEGWEATSVDLEPGTERTVWALGVLTDEREFLGVQQGGGSRDDLLELWLDEDAESQGEVTVDSAIGDTWEEWTDSSDVAYAAEIDGQEVLVHGSAPDEDVREFLGLLTLEPIR